MNPPETPALDKAETLKAASDYLRGSIARELAAPTDHFSADASALLKFHGMYQQDDRDQRQSSAQGKTKVYSLMVRGRIPGGRLSASQYAVWDDIASQYANGSLRITTRQSFQLHGVLKSNVKPVIQAIHRALLSTVAACGDVARNVTQAPNPLGLFELSLLDGVAATLSDHFKPKTPAYAEIWLDDEKVAAVTAASEDASAQTPETQAEPLYGATYLPRKFKMAVTLAGNNTVDLYSNDLGFAATLRSDGRIDGYFVFVGGGQGMTHNKPETFPRLADCLGWIPEWDLIPVAEAVLTTQRDYGDRSNRRHARLKYLLHDRGVEWFRGEVEARSGVRFNGEIPLAPWQTPSYLGWRKRADGRWSLGCHTLSGRIVDRQSAPLKSTLRAIIDAYALDVQLTCDQDLILLGVEEADKPAIEARLAEAGLDLSSPAPLYDRALACVALPTCGLAITESERYLPTLLPVIQSALERHGLSQRAPVVRMTGCPNGCARPYSAELALVGRSPGVYAVFSGGNVEGTRLAELLSEGVRDADFPAYVDRLFALWRAQGEPAERLGDFIARYSIPAAREALAPPSLETSS
ncbi:MAG: NADPH-dependent assimilatory sulfite reductase hemoprotein subunit [Vampirovibrionales bacterium]|nr:NADPH-dependent assimilatory sulfite reductase hemoprotein subunit [Vampirovibrionales bacterium]